jgi:hypothetical protein
MQCLAHANIFYAHLHTKKIKTLSSCNKHTRKLKITFLYFEIKIKLKNTLLIPNLWVDILFLVYSKLKFICIILRFVCVLFVIVVVETWSLRFGYRELRFSWWLSIFEMQAQVDRPWIGLWQYSNKGEMSRKLNFSWFRGCFVNSST